MLVVALSFVLALTLPVGNDARKGANAPVQTVQAQSEPAEAQATAEVLEISGVSEEPGVSEAPEEPEVSEPTEVPEVSQEPEVQTPSEAQTESEAPAEQSAAAIAAASDPETAELIRKYNVLDNVPTTRDPLGLSECARVEDSYFDDAIFVGDSVTLKLRQYVLQARQAETPTLLGAATFLAAQSFGTRNALREVSENSIHPVINGVKMTLEDAIAQSGAKKLYIMLGMNDVGVSGIDNAVDYMLQLLQRIQQKCPGIEIFVESATPRLSGTHPNTNQLFAYDVKLYDALVRLNDPTIHFVDVAYVMRDEEGKLYPDYCSDKDSMALHFTNAGCRAWIDYLYTHAAV